jgi:hypothetical protein
MPNLLMSAEMSRTVCANENSEQDVLRSSCETGSDPRSPRRVTAAEAKS